MSECTLYVLDAPAIASQHAALDFIAEWSERDAGESNASIEAFVRELLRTKPDVADDDGNVWYESPPPGECRAPVLALYFKLELFDAAMLQMLRALAGKHGLHVFDDEGHVLYLANGLEVGVSKADPLEALKGASCSPLGLRYDGVYAAKIGGGTSFFRFTADGRMFRQSVAGQTSSLRAFQQMVEGDPFVGHGTYVVEEQGISGKVKQTNGVFYIKAQLVDNMLSVTSVRNDGKFPFAAEYEFKAL